MNDSIPFDCPYDATTGLNDFRGQDDCFYYSDFERHCWCNFSRQVDDCEDTLEDGFIDYIDVAFCAYAQNENLWMPG